MPAQKLSPLGLFGQALGSIDDPGPREQNRETLILPKMPNKNFRDDLRRFTARQVPGPLDLLKENGRDQVTGNASFRPLHWPEERSVSGSSSNEGSQVR